uniref:DDE-1 domain-containing protein n=1 Tax=Globodera rostochiensis TaxID=31243 RepID=A0A914HR30_GLORO
MDDALTENYLQRVFGHGFFYNRLLVWDSFRCHISDSTKNALKQFKIDTAVVPGGCTKFVQAADVSWNAPFKAKIRQQYEDWMLHGEKTTTSSGNTRAAPMNIYLNWIHEAWEGIPKENISKSFKTCGITNAFDGSEDGEIHCFKEDGPVPNGMLRLQQAREMAEFDFLAEGIAGLFEEVDVARRRKWIC